MGTTSKNPEIPESLSGKYEDRLWRSKYLTSTQRESEGETGRAVDPPPPPPPGMHLRRSASTRNAARIRDPR